MSLLFFSSLLFISAVKAQTYSATYLPSNVPPTTEEGQTGTNQCGTALNQTSMCQNAYINSVTDWCIWSPPDQGPGSVIGNTERIEVAWCIKNGTGTRLIPDGAITGAHFVQTPDFVQITGTGNLTLLNIPVGDSGGELDPHGADGNGNPIGGLVFSSAFGQLEQIHEWTNFVSDTQFCFRACKPGPQAPTFCQHVYDVMGCAWNMPANYDAGVFENCQGDSGEPMGVYGTSTFHQGQPVTPLAHPIPSSSSCASVSTIGNGFFISGTSIGTVGPTSTSGPGGSGTSVGFRSSSMGSPISDSTLAGSHSTQGGATGSKSGSGSSPSQTGAAISLRVDAWKQLTISLGAGALFSVVGAFVVL